MSNKNRYRIQARSGRHGAKTKPMTIIAATKDDAVAAYMSLNCPDNFGPMVRSDGDLYVATSKIHDGVKLYVTVTKMQTTQQSALDGIL